MLQLLKFSYHWIWQHQEISWGMLWILSVYIPARCVWATLVPHGDLCYSFQEEQWLRFLPSGSLLLVIYQILKMHGRNTQIGNIRKGILFCHLFPYLHILVIHHHILISDLLTVLHPAEKWSNNARCPWIFLSWAVYIPFSHSIWSAVEWWHTW